ncbi:hypothetical protein BVX98_00395, partial [bacterium F11]
LKGIVESVTSIGQTNESMTMGGIATASFANTTLFSSVPFGSLSLGTFFHDLLTSPDLLGLALLSWVLLSFLVGLVLLPFDKVEQKDKWGYVLAFIMLAFFPAILTMTWWGHSSRFTALSMIVTTLTLVPALGGLTSIIKDKLDSHYSRWIGWVGVLSGFFLFGLTVTIFSLLGFYLSGGNFSSLLENLYSLFPTFGSTAILLNGAELPLPHTSHAHARSRSTIDFVARDKSVKRSRSRMRGRRNTSSPDEASSQEAEEIAHLLARLMRQGTENTTITGHDIAALLNKDELRRVSLFLENLSDPNQPDFQTKVFESYEEELKRSPVKEPLNMVNIFHRFVEILSLHQREQHLLDIVTDQALVGGRNLVYTPQGATGEELELVKTIAPAMVGRRFYVAVDTEEEKAAFEAILPEDGKSYAIQSQDPAFPVTQSGQLDVLALEAHLQKHDPSIDLSNMMVLKDQDVALSENTLTSPTLMKIQIVDLVGYLQGLLLRPQLLLDALEFTRITLKHA